MDNKTAFAQSCMHFPGGVNSPVRAFNAVGGLPFVVSYARGAVSC